MPVVSVLAPIVTAHVQPSTGHQARPETRPLSAQSSATRRAQSTWNAGNAATPHDDPCSQASSSPSRPSGSNGRFVAMTGTTSHSSVTTIVAAAPDTASRRRPRALSATSGAVGTNR